MKRFHFVAIFVMVAAGALYFWPEKTITWHNEDGFRWAALSVPWFGENGFEQLSGSDTGVKFSNNLTREQITNNRHLLNGSGVAVGDVTGDGLADIYFCRLNGSNALYKNLGNWKFEDITSAAGVACLDQFSTGTAFSDIDGDGDLDLLVTTLGGPNFCFLNDGQGNFVDVTNSAGLAANTGATSMALADIDGDGDLDLYVTNYKKSTVKDHYLPRELEFERIVKKVNNGYEIAPEFKEHYTVGFLNDTILMRYEYAEPDKLYLNDGTGYFSEVSFTDGRFLNEEGNSISQLHDWGLTTRFQDIDEDGDPDIFVCNDFESPDRVWLNDGNGNFQAIPKLVLRNTSWATMGIDFSDIDRDGDLDFFSLDMFSRDHKRRMTQKMNGSPVPHAIGAIDNRPQYSRNRLFLNRGDATYAEISQFSGVHASDWSWSPLFLDVDLDGYEDIVVATGHFYDALDTDTLNRMRKKRYRSLDTWRSKIFDFPSLKLPNIAFRNNGNLSFAEVGEEWGFSSIDISQGIATGDFDNDGDLDVVINRLNAPAGVYRNKSAAPRLAIRLRGLTPNTQAVGAKIRVLGGPVSQSKEVICAGSYLSSSDPFYMFATGESENLTIEVVWRSGKKSILNDVKANRVYEIFETEAGDTDANPSSNNIEENTRPLFEDVSSLLNHTHHEDKYNDFRYQPLLPRRLSQMGPGIAWHDIDNDGDDDLVIGSGKGGQMALFSNDGKGGFQRLENRLTRKSEYEQSSVLGWSKENGMSSLLLGSSNIEERSLDSSFVARYDFANDRIYAGQKIEASLSTIGPMSMADYDGDNDLDLFIGGRSVPGRYPEPASSKLYRNENGEFKIDAVNSIKFKELGLISGVVFSDLDSDGDADLVLAVEWGPVMVFRNSGGNFSDATKKFGLDKYLGWWQGVTTGDLNEDGKPEIIATNWGLNSKYEHRYNDQHPLELFYNDFDNNGTLDIIEAYFAFEMQKLVPERRFSWLQRAMPNISRRVRNNNQFSQSSVEEIIGPKLNSAKNLKANTLAHTIFFNRGENFEAVEMPAEAQFSPAFYIGVVDFDGDGHEDVFISQNFFASEMETPRSDAGRGLWLKGDGSGNLEAVDGHQSGVKVYGEQRGAGLCDYDRDGRVDLVISQNGGPTKLFHNLGAKPGLRIRLTGPKGNPAGVGATIRLAYEEGYGPAREIHLGSGYWSQDSMVQVMGFRENIEDVKVRWPGGNISTVPVSEGTPDITINFKDSER